MTGKGDDRHRDAVRCPFTWRLGTIPADRLPLLITGITGVAGLAAWHFFRRVYPGQVVGIRPEQSPRELGTGAIACDAADRARLDSLLRAYHVRSILNCAGNCALKACELNPTMAERLNVASALALATLARERGCRLVHLSSDLVYSGTKTPPGSNHAGYAETDEPDPVTVYGKTMAEGERIVARNVPEAVTLRISLPMGRSLSRHAGAIDWIESRFRHQRPATLYFDEIRSPAYVDDLCRVFERFLADETAGLFHLGGPRPLALFEIAQIVNRVGGYDPTLLRGCPRADAGPVPPRAGDVRMNSGRLHRHLGGDPLRPWPLEPELVPTDRHWHFRRVPDEPGSHARLAALLYSPLRERAPSLPSLS